MKCSTNYSETFGKLWGPYGQAILGFDCAEALPPAIPTGDAPRGIPVDFPPDPSEAPLAPPAPLASPAPLAPPDGAEGLPPLDGATPPGSIENTG